MGKRERHAAKRAERGQRVAGVAGAPRSKAKKLLGFKAGWGWGKAAVGLFLRHPLYLGAGHLMLIAALAAGWGLGQALGPWSAQAGSTAALWAIVAGVSCAGSAARARALAVRGAKPGWGAWVEGFGGGWAGAAKFMARSGLLLGVLAGLGWGAAQVQAALGASDPAWFQSWTARGVSLALIYLISMWGMAAASPARPWRDWMATLGRYALSPASMLGLIAFWILWMGLCNVIVSWGAAEAISWLGGQDVARRAMSSMTILALGALNAPIMAMSEGLGWAAVETHRGRAAQARMEASIAAAPAQAAGEAAFRAAEAAAEASAPAAAEGERA